MSDRSQRRPLAVVAALAIAVVSTVVGAVSTASAASSITARPGSATAVRPAAAAAACPYRGNITYTLNRAANPTPDQSSAYSAIKKGMDEALAVYNCHANISKALQIYYEPGVPTADGNINGTIRFGARNTMQRITAMHEIAHTLGVGTYWNWSPNLSGGVWNGANATNEIRRVTGDGGARIYGDRQHFWPYGLNQTSEVRSDNDLVNHVTIVVALRKDMGLQ